MARRGFRFACRVVGVGKGSGLGKMSEIEVDFDSGIEIEIGFGKSVWWDRASDSEFESS
jgi:hypothetical protein